MTSMYLKTDLIGAINLYCIKNNLHIKYIEKSRKSELEEVVIKYNINVEELLLELANQDQSWKIAQQESQKTIDEGINNIKGKIKMLISLLNDEQKEKFFEYCDSQKSNL